MWSDVAGPGCRATHGRRFYPPPLGSSAAAGRDAENADPGTYEGQGAPCGDDMLELSAHPTPVGRVNKMRLILALCTIAAASSAMSAETQFSSGQCYPARPLLLTFLNPNQEAAKTTFYCHPPPRRDRDYGARSNGRVVIIAPAVVVLKNVEGGAADGAFASSASNAVLCEHGEERGGGCAAICLSSRNSRMPAPWVSSSHTATDCFR